MVVAGLGVGSPAAADPTQIGAYFGPRLFSDDSRLGYIEDAPAHPTLDNSIQLGARVARPFFPWLVPELELAFAPTETNADRRRGRRRRVLDRAAAPPAVRAGPGPPPRAVRRDRRRHADRAVVRPA